MHAKNNNIEEYMVRMIPAIVVDDSKQRSKCAKNISNT